MKTHTLFIASGLTRAAAFAALTFFALPAPGAPAVCVVLDSGTSALANTSRAATDGVNAAITGTVTASGSWARASTSTANYYSYSLYDEAATTDATKWLSFAPTLPAAGKYIVQIWWSNSASQATNVPVDICHSGTTDTVYVNQGAQGTRWVTMGIWQFNATNDGTEFVKIRNNGGPGGATEGKIIRADAIRFLSYETLTELDNVAEIKTTPETDPTNYTGVYMIGSWSNSINTSGYYGTNYSNDGTKAATKAVIYTPVLPGPGHYDVQIWHPASGGFCAAVPVDICHSGATDTVTVNQQQNGGQWKSLGVYEFTAAGTEYIKIRTDDGAGGTLTGNIVADAARFVKVETGPLTLIDNTAPDDTDPASKIPGDGVTAQGTWTGSDSRPG
jgi:hypothetical protein